MLFLKKSCTLFLGILLYFNSYSQVRPNSFGNISIAENGFVTIFGQHNFMAGTGLLKPGTIKVNRSSNPGFLIYSNTSGWSGASEKQYIDGFVKSYHQNKFTFPVGHNGEYRPVCLSNSYASSVAYFNINPKKINSILDESISEISAVEYWSINLKEDSQITLSWSNASKIQEILKDDNLEQLTIIGLDNENQWKIIPSTIDEYVLNVSRHQGRYNKNTKSKHSLGSITSIDKVSAAAYKQFTVGSLKSGTDLVESSLNIYPNPQVVGTKINIDYDLATDSGIVRIFKSDNSLLCEVEVFSNSVKLQLPYLIKESGAYILSLTDTEGRTTFQNLIVID